MFLLGLMAVIQLIFLPGFLFLKAIGYRQSFPSTILFSFALSLLANYLMVGILTLLGGYTPTSVYTIFGIEFVFLMRYIKSPLKSFSIEKDAIAHHPNIDILWFSKKIAYFSVICLFFYYWYGDQQPKTIFSAWDAVVSWNRWALDWYKNTMPKMTGEYPQLVPISFSLTYQWMGNSTIQLFAKGICYLFPFAIVFSMWDLGKREENPAYFFSIGFFILFLITLFAKDSVTGYADLPVACLSMLAIYPLLLCHNEKSEIVIRKNALLGALICGSAAVTKQAGLILVLMYPFLMYGLVLRNSTIQNKARCLAISVCTTILICAPWYLYKFFQVHNGTDYLIVFSLEKGSGYNELLHPTFLNRFLYGWDLLVGSFHLPFKIVNSLLIVGLIIWGCSANKSIKQLVLLLVIPMFFIWMFFVSYDIRNIAFILPFASIALGFGLRSCLTFILTRKIILHTKHHHFVLLSTFLSVITLCIIYQNDRLLTEQVKAQKTICNQNVNTALYSYFSEHPGSNEKVLTNYQILHFLPSLESRYVFNSGHSTEELLNNQKKFPKHDILLMIEPHTVQIENYLKDNPHYAEIFKIDNFIFYKWQART